MFITFEGPDGSGKTTAIKSLTKHLNEKGVEFILTREPGTDKSNEARQIREIILNPENKITPMTEAILFAADRRLHLETLIWPALKKKKLVLCDRYLDSSLAYQGYGKKLGFDAVLDLNMVITEKTMPDLTIFFDIKPKQAAKRVDARSGKDRMELEDDKFRKRVYKGYQEVLKRFPERVKVIDASLSKEEVADKVIDIISHALKL